MNSPIKDTNAERMEQIQRDQLQDALAEMHRGRVLYIYSADRHCESTNDAQIDLRCSAMVETE